MIIISDLTPRQPEGAGFYRVEGDVLARAPNFVRGPGYDLFAQDHETYTYPVEGWTWYADETSARAALGLPPVDESQT